MGEWEQARKPAELLEVVRGASHFGQPIPTWNTGFSPRLPLLVYASTRFYTKKCKALKPFALCENLNLLLDQEMQLPSSRAVQRFYMFHDTSIVLAFPDPIVISSDVLLLTC